MKLLFLNHEIFAMNILIYIQTSTLVASFESNKKYKFQTPDGVQTLNNNPIDEYKMMGTILMNGNVMFSLPLCFSGLSKKFDYANKNFIAGYSTILLFNINGKADNAILLL